MKNEYRTLNFVWSSVHAFLSRTAVEESGIISVHIGPECPRHLNNHVYILFVLSQCKKCLSVNSWHLINRYEQQEVELKGSETRLRHAPSAAPQEQIQVQKSCLCCATRYDVLQGVLMLLEYWLHYLLIRCYEYTLQKYVLRGVCTLCPLIKSRAHRLDQHQFFLANFEAEDYISQLSYFLKTYEVKQKFISWLACKTCNTCFEFYGTPYLKINKNLIFISD